MRPKFKIRQNVFFFEKYLGDKEEDAVRSIRPLIIKSIMISENEISYYGTNGCCVSENKLFTPKKALSEFKKEIKKWKL